VGERLDGDAMAHRQEETPEVLNAHVVLIWIATACRLGDSSTLSEEEERGRWYLQNCTSLRGVLQQGVLVIVFS
jgi:hypothetical protein